MRILLLTGAGGAGTTTAAAATAALLAARGRKALVLSAPADRGLPDALDAPVGADPGAVDAELPGFAAMAVDAQRRLERSWAGAGGRLGAALAAAGLDPPRPEELAVVPGLAELLALLELRDVARGPWDVLVVDAGPVPAALRLLALPETLSWYVERLDPVHRRAVRAAPPTGPFPPGSVGSGLLELAGRFGAGLLANVATAAGTVPPGAAGDALLAVLGALQAELADVRELLADPTLAAVRLVVAPAAGPVAATVRQAGTALALYGYRVDGVLANRLLPAGAAAGWSAPWAAAEAGRLTELVAAAGGVPVWRAAARPVPPVGLAALTDLGREFYGDADPADPGPGGNGSGGSGPGAPAAGTGVDPRPVLARVGDDYEFRLPLPHADPAAVQVGRSSADLVVTVARWRRVVVLPAGLRRCVLVSAELDGGVLRVRFRPDPELWPRLSDAPGA